MKLTWHIFAKDLRRLALPLLLWGTLAVLQFLAFLYFKSTSTGSSDDSLGFAADMFLWGLQLAAAWLLVPILIQDDSLLSDRAAWRTRPISGGRLLGAKLLGLLVMFCLWPTLLTLPWWLAFGFGAGEIARVMAVHALGMIVFVELAVVVAVMTETIVRFLAWSFVLVFGCGIGLFTISAEISTLDGGPGTVAAMLTRASLAFAIVAAGVVTVVLLQFLTRRFRLAVALAGVTAIVAGLVVWQWPWGAGDLLARTGLARFALPTAMARVRGVTLFVPPEGRGRKAALHVTTEFATPDIAAGDQVEWQQLEGTLRHGATGRLPFEMRLQFLWRSAIDGDRSDLAMLAGRGDVRGSRTFSARGRLELPAAIAPRLRSGTAILGGDVVGALWHPEQDLKVPFRAGEGGGGFHALHLLAVRPQPLRGEAGTEWLETTDVFTPEAVLELLVRKNHLPEKQESLFVRGGGEIDSLRANRPTEAALRIGLLSVGFNQSDDRYSTDDTRDGSYRIARFPDATLTGLTAHVVAPLAARLTDTPLVPDLVVEGDVDLALRRAQAEGKLVLVMVHGRDYDPAAQVEPNAWTEPQVRELLHTRFVCAQVFGNADPRFAPLYIESRFVAFVVLMADGRRQDAFLDPWQDEKWLTALAANARGETYAAQLRAELAAKDGNDRTLRERLSNALLARGEFDEAVLLLLRMAESEPNRSWASWQTPWGLWGMASRLEMLIGNNPALRTALQQRRMEAAADLRRDPRDVLAARRLYIATLALKDPQTMAEFPRLLPRENPAHWSLLTGWLVSFPGPEETSVPRDVVDWEDFFSEGRGWVQERLAETRQARRDKLEDYINLVNKYRGRMVRVGVTGVRVLAASGQIARAQRLAEQVLEVDSRRWTRSSLARPLEGKVDAKVLHDIDPLGNH